MNNKLQPAIIGGVVLGVLSAIPFVNLGNVLCCMWVVLGGALAVYLYIKKSPTPVDIGEGALIGLLAGVIGSVVRTLLAVPLTIMAGYPVEHLLINVIERVDPMRAEMTRIAIEDAMRRPYAEQFITSVFSLGTLLGLLVTVIFALVGGLVAVPLFERRKADAVLPPPPPSYGGGMPGGGYTPPPTYPPSEGG
ncbi:MAG TPA: hypothetical protein VF723_07380 [Pyrinomonadaceae bacterium]